VTVLDIDESAAAAVAKEIETDGGKAKAYPCDVSELESVKTSFQEIFAAGKNRISRETARLLAEQSGRAGGRRRMGHDASNGGCPLNPINE
jgi:NAD(P)-dependent dehydrogenase (short-subunit alcohol dehydrogenase family)